MIKKFVLILIINICIGNLNAQVIINEASSSSYDVLVDEDSDRPDWIELYNDSDKDINLESWRISDGKSYEKAWVFPKAIIKANDYLLVLASDKNYSNSDKFIMEASGNGIYPHSNPDSYRFENIELSGDFEFSVRVHSLSNVDVFGSVGVIIREDTTSINRFFGVFGQREDRNYCEFLKREKTGFYPVRIYSNKEMNYPDLVLKVSRKGDSLFAGIYDYEGYCHEKQSILSDYPEKVYVGIALSSTDDDRQGRVSFSNLMINGSQKNFDVLTGRDYNLKMPGKSYKSNELHTDFKLSSGGEKLILWDNNGNIADELTIPQMIVDVSFGRSIEGLDSVSYFQPPTPGYENKNNKIGILKTPEFSTIPGIYKDTISVRIENLNSDSKLYYTNDGSEPDTNSILYHDEDIIIGKSTVIKAIVFAPDYVPSQMGFASYIINPDNLGMPIVSISSNKEYFFDENIGIFERIFEKFEYPCTFEYFDSSATRVYDIRAGVKIHGGASLQYPQKSVRFHTRSKWGESEFSYPFFGHDYSSTNDKIILRNGGQDRNGAFLRDAFVNKIARNIPNLVTTACKPVLTYLNGEFWGIYNLRQRTDDNFIELNFKVPSSSVSVVESPLRVISGAVNSYKMMVDSIVNNNSEFSGFEIFKRHADYDNFIKYTTLAFFAINSDWPVMNLRFWKSSALDNKWRWFVHDMDLTTAISEYTDYRVNHISNILNLVDANDPHWHFGHLLKELLKDTLFVHQYLNTTADILNSYLLFENTNSILDKMVSDIKPGVDLQNERWPESLANFGDHIELIREFIEKRPQYYREQLRGQFNISGISKIALNSYSKESCTFRINSLSNLPVAWQGYYFNDVPIEITVNPSSGNKFIHWKLNDVEYSSDNSISIILTDSTELLAVFENDQNQTEKTVVINEIMFKSSPDQDTDDWIEIYNNSDSDIDISNWVLKDDKDSRDFTLPEGTILKSKEYLVLIESETNFSKFHPNVTNYYGEFTFGFGTSDIVRIYDKSGNLVDSVKYSNVAPWHPEADGGGPSLELIDPTSDNGIPSSWRVSKIPGGTPGTPNSTTGVEQFIESKHIIAYPNPTSEVLNLKVATNESANYSIKLYDILGTEILQIHNGFIPANTEKIFSIPTSSLSIGSYYYVISGGGLVERGKVMVVR